MARKTFDGPREEHPAMALITVTKATSTPPATLFGSDVPHQHYIHVEIQRADRQRELGRDWLHGTKNVISFSLSLTQWAELFSSIGDGHGTPCTLEWTEKDGFMPAMEFEPRLKTSLEAVKEAAGGVLGRIKEAMATYREKKSASNLRDLELAITQAEGTISFLTRTLDEHVEKVVSSARTDLEAAVADAVAQHGLSEAPAEVKAIMSGIVIGGDLS